MRILYIRPVAAGTRSIEMAKVLRGARREGTVVDLVSLPIGGPTHLEYHTYEGLAIGDIVRHVHAASHDYDAAVIGGFYDVGLREAREISGQMIVTAPCEASTSIARCLGNTFSVIVGRRKWIPRITKNINDYGHRDAVASVRAIGVGVNQIQSSKQTAEHLLAVGRQCVEEDRAEVLILGCTADYGFHEQLQEKLGVPVIDPLIAGLKHAELMVETARRFGWYPSRKWGSEPPPDEEINSWKLFKSHPPTGDFVPGD